MSQQDHFPRADVLGEPYTVEVIELEPDDEGPVVAHLVRRPSDLGKTNRAVLHVHGFSDYFFHTEFAEWWTARGYDFYAIDLRKYGRSLAEHQTPYFTEDLSVYYDELTQAWQRITERDGHDFVISSAHSTGGLTLPLWVNKQRPHHHVGMLLNSPWFELQGPAWLRGPGTGVIKAVASRQPRRAIRRTGPGHYGKALHTTHGGEWDFELAWKPIEPKPIHFGWLAAVRRGHAELHRGLNIEAPVLVLSSLRSSSPFSSDGVHDSDTVLDVTQIRRWAPSLGRHVTSVAIDGARHDVVLSTAEVRAEVYHVLAQWVGAFVDPALSEPSETGLASGQEDH